MLKVSAGSLENLANGNEYSNGHLNPRVAGCKIFGFSKLNGSLPKFNTS
jgi:hypothetical protein